MVGDLGLTYRNPDPVGGKAGEGLAAAYGEAVVPQAESDPARCMITAYATGVDEHERRLGPAGHREPQLRQLVKQVAAVCGDLIAPGGNDPGVGVRQAMWLRAPGRD